MSSRFSAPAGPVLVVVASPADAAALASLARDVAGDEAVAVTPVLVATGADPMQVDLALDDRGALAAHVLLVAEAVGPAQELAVLMPRLDDLIAEARPVGVLVRGGSTAALAAAQCAVWRGVPAVHVPAPEEIGPALPTQAAVAALVAWQRAIACSALRSVSALDGLVRLLAPPPMLSA